jgi:hypothetical protein
LLNADSLGIQPRLAMAWRPIPGSSLVVRAGYGIYRNASVYQPIATLLAQQPPLSHTFSIENSAATSRHSPTPLPSPRLARSIRLRSIPTSASHRAQLASLGAADLPRSLTVTATYFGTHGTHLMQEFLPNSYAPARPIRVRPVRSASSI